MLSATSFIVTNEMWIKIGTEPFRFFLYMLGFVRFINLTFIVTLNVSSFLWEYWYLLIPEICNLGHGNYHRVAISKTFTKRLNMYYEYSKFVLVASFFDHFVSVFLILFCPNNISISCSFYIFVLFEYQTLRALDQLGSIFEIL